MRSFVATFMHFAICLSFCAWLLTGCSGSSSDTVTPQLPADTTAADTNGEATQDDGESPDAVGGTGVDTPEETEGETESAPVVPDPLVQNTVSVDFDITVPAYVSDALQVRLTWNDKNISARWVGDEFWSASDDFPTDTEHLLVVTFSDRNGEITLGSVERNFKTGTNASESYQISADMFDTERWDDDGDSVSNLDELAAGTYGAASPRVLLFSETQGYRHPSIANALPALEELAAQAGITTDRADDSEGLFTTENLSNYDAVIWVLTSGDVLNSEEQTAFENYIRAGGGYAGIHSASDTEYEWPWYGSLVGAYFDKHPAIQTATQIVEDESHQSTTHLGASWTRTDEWYDFRNNPRAQVNVLLRLDESTYSEGGMGDDHPIAWYHEFDGGRSWYTGGGHTEASYDEPDFRAHLLGGLRYAAGL